LATPAAALASTHERARAAGLDVHVDSAANHSAVLPARDKRARTLMLGSHLDSVHNGGRYDGALGVVCALEVLRTIQDASLDLPVALEAVDFTDEEGKLIGTLPGAAVSFLLPSSHAPASPVKDCWPHAATRIRSPATSSSTSSRARCSSVQGPISES
jgi:hypothetical protein